MTVLMYPREQRYDILIVHLRREGRSSTIAQDSRAPFLCAGFETISQEICVMFVHEAPLREEGQQREQKEVGRKTSGHSFGRWQDKRLRFVMGQICLRNSAFQLKTIKSIYTRKATCFVPRLFVITAKEGRPEGRRLAQASGAVD